MVEGDEGIVQVQGLSCAERKSLQDFLAYIELRVRPVEPFCAYLIRMAEIALDATEAPKDGPRTLN